LYNFVHQFPFDLEAGLVCCVGERVWTELGNVLFVLFWQEPQGWDDSKPGRSLARFCVAVEAGLWIQRSEKAHQVLKKYEKK
jgi:hypothetical protein